MSQVPHRSLHPVSHSAQDLSRPVAVWLFVEEDSREFHSNTAIPVRSQRVKHKLVSTRVVTSQVPQKNPDELSDFEPPLIPNLLPQVKNQILWEFMGVIIVKV